MKAPTAPPGQAPGATGLKTAFIHAGRPAFIVARRDGIDMHVLAWEPNKVLGGVGVALVAVGLVCFALGFTVNLGLAAVACAPFNLGLAALSRGRDPRSAFAGGRGREAVKDAVASQRPLHVWPRDVPIEWGRRIRIKAPGGDVVIKGDLPHRRGLRAMLER